MDFPDYYAVLGVAENATFEQIKTAYKRASLKCHPDRIPAGDKEAEARRRRATVEFQAVSDAYYTLSDPARRKAYDGLRATQPKRTADASSSGSYFDFFKNAAPASDYAESTASDASDARPDPHHVFGDVFEDLLRPEVNRHLPLWTWLGAASGAALGFIAGNLPGAAVGGYGGSRLGAIRDAKGKAVYQVFQELGSNQKAEILKALAAKVFGMTGIGGQSSSQ